MPAVWLLEGGHRERNRAPDSKDRHERPRSCGFRKAFAEALMGVEAEVMCGAPHGSRSPEPDHGVIIRRVGAMLVCRRRLGLTP